MSWTLFNEATATYKKHIEIAGASHSNAFRIGEKQLVSAIDQLNSSTHSQ
jgi:hypothetical protein